MSVHRRLLAGLLAGAFGQSVTIGIQLVSLPVFLYAWGTRQYGEWLLLSAVPAYLALSDMGFSSVASNQMTMDVAAGRRAEALRIFQSTLMIVLAAALLVLGVIVASSFFPIERFLNLHLIGHSEAVWALWWLALQVGLGFIGGLISAGYRCEGGYARVTLLANTVRLAEFVGSVVTLLLGGGPAAVAFSVTAIRLIGTLGMRLDLVRIAPWIRFGTQHAQFSQIKSLTSPALAFATWPLAAALQQQGMVIIVGSLLGSTSVVVWSACRTVARALFQMSGILNSALWPELSRSLGEGNFDLSRRLHRLAVAVSLWCIAPFAVLLFLLRDLIFRFWSHGALVVASSLFALTLLQTVVNLVWGTSSIVAAAVNRHQSNSVYYVFLILLGVGLAIPLTHAFGLDGATVSLLLSDIGMFPIALFNALRILEDDVLQFGMFIAKPPISEAKVLLSKLRS